MDDFTFLTGILAGDVQNMSKRKSVNIEDSLLMKM